MDNSKLLWVDVYACPIVRKMDAIEIRKVFECLLPDEIEDKLFLKSDGVITNKTKKVFSGWGDKKKKVGVIVGFKLDKKNQLKALVSVVEPMRVRLEKKMDVARVDATKDIETGKVTFHGLLVSDQQ
jgi:hypothetical protein